MHKILTQIYAPLIMQRPSSDLADLSPCVTESKIPADYPANGSHLEIGTIYRRCEKENGNQTNNNLVITRSAIKIANFD